jgi:hypothetical protein
MPFSQGARSRLTVAAEASFGVLAQTPEFYNLPYKTHSLALNKNRVQGADILGDRMQTVDRHGTRAVGGSIEVDLRRGAYDMLLESAFFSTFNNSGQISIGTTPRFLAFEDAALDIGQYQLFSGCLVNSVSFSIAPDQMVQATFEIVGRNKIQSTSSADASPTPAANYEPFDSFSGVLFEGGLTNNDDLCIVSSLQFSINNNVTPAHVILCAENSDQAAQMQFGMATIEGTMSVYYQDAVLINKFLNETESILSVTVDDSTGTNGYTFYFPRIKYNGATVPVANPQSRIIELPFVALKHSTLGFSLRLTRPT